MNQPKRATIYVRVSHSTQTGEDKTSPATQETACREYCEAQGYQVVDVRFDTHTGSELYERPEMSRLLDDIRHRRLDVVVAFSVDRAFRDQNAVGVVLFECQRAEVRLEFATEKFDDTPVGRFLLGATTFAAELERVKIIERTQRGMRQRLNGTRVSPFTFDQYGFTHERDAEGKRTGRKVINEEEATVVRQIYKWVIEGVSGFEICRRLTEQGVKPPGDKLEYQDGRQPRWHPTGINRLVANPAYRGVTAINRQKVEKRELKTQPGEYRRHPYPQPVSEWTIFEDSDLTPAIVPASVWELANERLRVNRGEWHKNKSRPRLLRGRVYCAKCHSRMYPERVYRCQHQAAYRCRSRKAECRGSSRVPAEPCEEWTWGRLKELLEHPDRMTDEIIRRRQQLLDPTLPDRQEGLEQALRKLTTNRSKLLDHWLEASDVMKAAIEQKFAELDKEQERLQTELAEIRRQLEAQSKAVVDFDRLRQLAEEYVGELENADEATKLRILTELDVKVFASGRR